MEKEFIPYEQALELKELGFDEPCLAVYRGGSLYGSGTSVSGYYQDGHWQLEKNSDYGDEYKKQWVSASTYSQAFRWFREKYEIHFDIRAFVWDFEKQQLAFKISFYINPFDNSTKRENWFGVYLKYEEAELACLKEFINLVKNK